MPSPSRADLEEAARAHFTQLAKEFDQPREFDRDHHDEDVSFNIDCSRDRIRALDDQLRQSAFDEAVKLRASELMAEQDWSPDGLTDRERLFAEQLAARAEREYLHQFIEFLRRPHLRPVAEDPLFDLSLEPQASSASLRARHVIEQPELTVREAVADYLNRQTARNLGKSQIEELSRALRWFREEVGDRTALGAVETAALRKFRDGIGRLDVKLQGRHLPFKNRLTNVAERQVKSVTARRYWRSVQTFFAWCVAEQLLQNDPAAGLKLDIKKGQIARKPPPFSEPELRRLFETPLYAGYQSPKRVSVHGPLHQRAGHWWSGMLLLFTGLRAGELSQLLPEDFSFDVDTPHLKVREVDDQGRRVKSTKNRASVRDVPIAPQLLQLGLRTFVSERALISGTGRIFREFRLGTKGRQSDGLTKFWAAYLRKFGLWKPGRSTHVFRHTFVACLRANDVVDEDIAALVGHSAGTITASYGGGYPLARKLRTLERLDYGFDVVSAVGGPVEETSTSAPKK